MTLFRDTLKLRPGNTRYTPLHPKILIGKNEKYRAVFIEQIYSAKYTNIFCTNIFCEPKANLSNFFVFSWGTPLDDKNNNIKTRPNTKGGGWQVI